MYVGFLLCDRNVKAEQDESTDDGDRSGSTAVAAFITPTHVVVAHAGYSRAVLASGQEARAANDFFAARDLLQLKRSEKNGHARVYETVWWCCYNSLIKYFFACCFTISNNNSLTACTHVLSVADSPVRLAKLLYSAEYDLKMSQGPRRVGD